MFAKEYHHTEKWMRKRRSKHHTHTYIHIYTHTRWWWWWFKRRGSSSSNVSCVVIVRSKKHKPATFRKAISVVSVCCFSIYIRSLAINWMCGTTEIEWVNERGSSSDCVNVCGRMRKRACYSVSVRVNDRSLLCISFNLLMYTSHVFVCCEYIYIAHHRHSHFFSFKHFYMYRNAHICIRTSVIRIMLARKSTKFYSI